MNLFQKLKDKAMFKRNQIKSRRAYEKAHPKEALAELRQEKANKAAYAELQAEKREMRRESFSFLRGAGANIKKNLQAHSNETRGAFFNPGPSILTQTSSVKPQFFKQRKRRR